MESRLRAALLDWLRSDPQLQALNAVAEESPIKVSPPWLGIAASAAIDWGSKDRPGYEVRIALELELRMDRAGSEADLVDAVVARVRSLPRLQEHFEIATIRLLRSRTEQRPRHLRASLLEFRFRLLSLTTE